MGEWAAEDDDERWQPDVPELVAQSLERAPVRRRRASAADIEAIEAAAVAEAEAEAAAAEEEEAAAAAVAAGAMEMEALEDGLGGTGKSGEWVRRGGFERRASAPEPGMVGGSGGGRLHAQPFGSKQPPSSRSSALPLHKRDARGRPLPVAHDADDDGGDDDAMELDEPAPHSRRSRSSSEERDVVLPAAKRNAGTDRKGGRSVKAKEGSKEARRSQRGEDGASAAGGKKGGADRQRSRRARSPSLSSSSRSPSRSPTRSPSPAKAEGDADKEAAAAAVPAEKPAPPPRAPMTEEERRQKFEAEFGDLDALDQVCGGACDYCPQSLGTWTPWTRCVAVHTPSLALHCIAGLQMTRASLVFAPTLHH
eukprot:891998-Pelagomonas_calceolata.AAC.3